MLQQTFLLQLLQGEGGVNPQNLVCNQENKKISVDGQGNISIADAGPELISFTINDSRIGGAHLYQAEKGMTWTQWCERPEYNTDGFVIYYYDDEYYVVADSLFTYGVTDFSYVDVLDIILNNHVYGVNYLGDPEPHP